LLFEPQRWSQFQQFFCLPEEHHRWMFHIHASKGAYCTPDAEHFQELSRLKPAA